MASSVSVRLSVAREAQSVDSAPPGFKQTEIGLIPEEWEVLKLTDVCQKTRQCTPQADEEFEYIDVSSVSNETFKITGSIQHKGSSAPSRARKPVQANDVLFATVRPTLKRVAMIPKHLDGQVCSTAFCVVRANSELSDPGFLYQLLLTDDLNDRISERQRGSSYPAVTDSDVLNQIIPLPPLPEQRAIAHVLSKIQAAAEAQAVIAERARELKRALMAKLFTEGLRGEPLKETEIGLMPKGWEVVRLGDVSEFLQYGTSERCDIEPNGIPVLRIPNVIEGKIDITDLKYLKNPKKASLKLTLKVGDVLFVRTNGRREYVGRCAVFNNELEEALFASYLIRARLKPDLLSPVFFQMYSMTEKGREFLSGKASNAADGKFNINTQTLKAVLLPLPPIDEQREIARILQTVDAKIATAECMRAGLDELFRAMLGQLMTGRVRVKGVLK